MSRIFIGVAWPYANGPIHVGHMAGCNLPPDIFAKYHRMKGNQVLMVSGSDMHGTPVTVKAEAEGITPGELAQRYHLMNLKAIEDFGIGFDLFLTTENSTHKEVVQAMFLRLLERGYLYEKDMELPFCPRCQRTLPDRYVEGECPFCHYEDARGDQCDECGKLLDPDMLISPRCATCGTAPEFVRRRHFFFRLSALEEQLKDWLADKDYWRPHVLNFTRQYIAGGLKDRPVTRDTTWGIEVPLEGHEDKRIYVWFEAFMGYYTMAVEWARRRGEPDAWREFWQDPECRHYYFLGKDNIPFHTIFWPAVLMAHGDLNLPYDVPANAFLRFGGQQFSKSRGISLDIKDLVKEYDPDALRYYMAVIMPENRDADFTWEDFAARNNNELVATYGNFVHRALSFTHKHFGQVPEGGLDSEAAREIEAAVREVGQHIERCEFKAGIKRAMDLARFGNRYIDSRAPWKQVKEDRQACADTLFTTLCISRALAVIMAPYMPFSSRKLWKALGGPGDVLEAGWDDALEPVRPGTPLDRPEPLFHTIEPPAGGPDDEDKEDAHMDAKTEGASGLELLDLRVGQIAEVKDHPNADKLLVLDVDLGGERRQLCAGLKAHYRPEELAGRNIIVVCNLKPAKLRGMMSEGMLLAAESGSTVTLLQPPDDTGPGAQVDGTVKGADQITFPDFQKFRLQIGQDGNAEYLPAGGGSIPLAVGGSPVRTDREAAPGSPIR